MKTTVYYCDGCGLVDYNSEDWMKLPEGWVFLSDDDHFCSPHCLDLRIKMAPTGEAAALVEMRAKVQD